MPHVRGGLSGMSIGWSRILRSPPGPGGKHYDLGLESGGGICKCTWSQCWADHDASIDASVDELIWLRWLRLVPLELLHAKGLDVLIYDHLQKDLQRA
jgi:hypothetical protein